MYRRLIYAFLVLLAILQPAKQDARTLVDFDNDSVRATAKISDGHFAVALGNEIQGYLMSGNNENVTVEKLFAINLSSLFFGNDVLLEFKPMSPDKFVVCTEATCGLCTLDTCEELDLTGGDKYSYISAAIVSEEKIVIRAVQAHQNASIFVFESPDNAGFKQVQVAADNVKMQDVNVVDSFIHGRYTFFVGTATRIDLPSMHHQNQRMNTEGRITRICNDDQTDDLESRMDLVLSCEGIDYNDTRISIKNRLTAATFDPVSGILYAAFKIRDSQNAICSYSLNDIQNTYNYTWTQCQKHSENISQICRQFYDYADLDKACFLMTWKENLQIPVCRAFNGKVNTFMDNCNLHESTTLRKRNAWLENFFPLDGKVQYVGNESAQFMDLKLIGDGTIYALGDNNNVYRLLLDNNSSLKTVNEDHQLSSKPALSGPRVLGFDKKNSIGYFVNPRLSAISQMHTNCNDFYDSCDNISWKDPLKCAFCAVDDGSGQVIPAANTCNGILMKDICPPMIESFNKQEKDSLFFLYGKKFMTFKDPLDVYVCGQKCAVTSKADARIECRSNVSNQCDNIELAGKLNENYPNFKLKKSTDTSPNMKPSGGGMTVLRYAAFVIAAIFFMGVLVAIYFLILHFKRNNFLNKENDQYSPVDTGMPMKHLKFAQLGQILGQGNAATVYEAMYKNDKVAVKVLKDWWMPLDAQKEIDLLSKLKHKNIVQYIDCYTFEYKIHIIMELMTGGSLLDYISNENSLLTIGHCYNFILQITSAMIYIHSQQCIHRDLATRNCLLDAKHQVLKISDFGLARQANYQSLTYKSTQTDVQLPLRWVALEVLINSSKFSDKSDVWAFGVTVWETFMRGQSPYMHLEVDCASLKRYLQDGNRLEIPEQCPPNLFALLQQCWDENPDMRPGFEEINDIVSQQYEQLKIFNSQSNEYENPRRSNDEYALANPIYVASR